MTAAPDTSPEAVEHIAKCLDAAAAGGDDFKSWLGQTAAATLRALSAELARARDIAAYVTDDQLIELHSWCVAAAEDLGPNDRRMLSRAASIVNTILVARACKMLDQLDSPREVDLESMLMQQSTARLMDIHRLEAEVAALKERLEVLAAEGQAARDGLTDALVRLEASERDAARPAEHRNDGAIYWHGQTFLPEHQWTSK